MSSARERLIGLLRPEFHPSWHPDKRDRLKAIVEACAAVADEAMRIGSSETSASAIRACLKEASDGE